MDDATQQGSGEDPTKNNEDTAQLAAEQQAALDAKALADQQQDDASKQSGAQEHDDAAAEQSSGAGAGDASGTAERGPDATGAGSGDAPVGEEGTAAEGAGQVALTKEPGNQSDPGDETTAKDEPLAPATAADPVAAQPAPIVPVPTASVLLPNTGDAPSLDLALAVAQDIPTVPNDIHARVSDVVKSFATVPVPEGDLPHDFNLFGGDLGVPLNSSIALGSAIGDHFGIDIHPSEAENFSTIRDILRFVLRRFGVI